MRRRVLVVTGWFYFPPRGADDMDRIEGIRQLTRIGYDVEVITRGFEFSRPHVDAARKQLGVVFTMVPYELGPHLGAAERISAYARRLLHPTVPDGSTWEFITPSFRAEMKRVIRRFEPDVVMVDGTSGWPAVNLVPQEAMAVIRSLNFEPLHVLQEYRHSPQGYIRSVIRWPSEIRAARKPARLFAVTPNESRFYRKLGAKNVSLLPLRGLASSLRRRSVIRDNGNLHAFFMGSTFNVPHMRAALQMIVRSIAPQIEARAPGRFMFHVLGAKPPRQMMASLPPNVRFEGYVPDLDGFLDQMDVAVAPSLFGAGMQQKIFDPLCRGIPTVTHARGLAGYPFEDEHHVLYAEEAIEFVEAMMRLQDLALRRRLADASSVLSAQLFSRERLDAIVMDGIGAAS